MANPAAPNKTPQPDRNPSPKQRFLLNGGFCKAHHAMVDSEAFERAADFAMLQYHLALNGKVNDAVSASAVGFKMQGAQEFLMIFRKLADTTPVALARPNDNLKHS
jgi:hypothetical protein